MLVFSASMVVDAVGAKSVVSEAKFANMVVEVIIAETVKELDGVLITDFVANVDHAKEEVYAYMGRFGVGVERVRVRKCVYTGDNGIIV